mmetsp:Transcript_93/g.234  ORF Transcript_93/g.234 Transcript_93/m.234 type:complete len:83 (-) Transcript_93:1123-1371(-)
MRRMELDQHAESLIRLLELLPNTRDQRNGDDLGAFEDHKVEVATTEKSNTREFTKERTVNKLNYTRSVDFCSKAFSLSRRKQ